MTDRQIREKLATRGAASLTDAELVSLLISHVGDGVSSYDMAGRILDSAGGGLSALSGRDMLSMRMLAGMGLKRAAQISVALELGRRLGKEVSQQITVVNSNDDVLGIFRPLLGSLRHEELWALYLSSANRVMDRVKISQGGITSTIADHRLVVKRALELLSTSIILVHNHPSGDATASPEDIDLTERIAKAAALFDITLLDHLIIAQAGSFSFRHRGLLK